MTRIKKTYLSRKPASGSIWWSLNFMLVLAAFSVVAWTDFLGLADLLPAQSRAIFEGREYWRLWSAIGVHADLRHLLSNAVFFVLLGYLLKGYFGIWGFPTLPILLGGWVNYLTLLGYPRNASLVGASGVVYLMAGLWLGLYCLIERKHSVGRRLVNSVAFILILLFPETFDPKVSYLSHTVGFIVGALLSPVLFLLKRREIRQAEVHIVEEALELPENAHSTQDATQENLPPEHECHRPCGT